MRSKEILAALITAAGTILAALLAHRAKVSTSLETKFLVLPALIAGGIVILFGLIIIWRRVTFGVCRDFASSPWLVRWTEERLRDPNHTGTTLIAAGLLAILTGLAVLAEPRPQLPHASQEKVFINCEAEEDMASLIREYLHLGVETPYFTITPAPFDELLEGERGVYFFLDLKDASDTHVEYFEANEYHIDAFSSRFGASIAAFVRDVIRPLEGIADYALFVRGSADKDAPQGLMRPLLPNYYYTSINYYPQSGPNYYILRETVHTVHENYTNTDLPFLRARFIQESLKARVYDLPAARILEGEIHQTTHEDLRQAAILLFIDWNKK